MLIFTEGTWPPGGGGPGATAQPLSRVNTDGSGAISIGTADDPEWGVLVTYSAPGLPNTPTDQKAPADRWPLVAAVAGLGLVGLVSLLKYRQLRQQSKR